jgi:hypothetical protein
VLLSRSAPNPVSLSPLIGLKNLDLRIVGIQEEGPDPRLSMLLYSVLDTLHTPSPLETISIQSPSQTALGFLSWQTECKDPAWKLVDNLLSNIQGFPKLKSAEVWIGSFEFGLETEELATETLLMRNALPRCQAAGLNIIVMGRLRAP